jgi:hypothetical protein
MTETEWLTCADPQKILAFLRGKASDRKLRHFALACIRPYLSMLDTESLEALAVAERFAEDLATNNERKQARKRVLHSRRSLRASTADRDALAKQCALWTLAHRPSCAAFKAAECARELGVLCYDDQQADTLEKTQCGWKTADWTSTVREQVLLQVNILHDLFDDQFLELPFDLTWLTDDVIKLARSIYDEHTFGRLPSIADKLAAAGCDNEELLAHCRNGKLHYRGCWAVDLILAKS